jgi:peptidoglycan/xylan/chitin deacetylase (PgdA/CDA1 family)
MPATPSSSPWPEGCEGAVSLTFDDGLRSQLETAIPLLDEHGLQTTFYLNPPHDGDEDDWRARRRDRLWTAPVVTIATRIQQWRSGPTATPCRHVVR